jgi:hypothetical protein
MPENLTRQIVNDIMNSISDKCDDIKKFPVYSSDVFPNHILNFLNRGLCYIRSQAIISPEKHKEVIKESVALYKLISNKYERFDEVRNLLCDEQSINTFN